MSGLFRPNENDLVSRHRENRKWWTIYSKPFMLTNCNFNRKCSIFDHMILHWFCHIVVRNEIIIQNVTKHIYWFVHRIHILIVVTWKLCCSHCLCLVWFTLITVHYVESDSFRIYVDIDMLKTNIDATQSKKKTHTIVSNVTRIVSVFGYRLNWRPCNGTSVGLWFDRVYIWAN